MILINLHGGIKMVSVLVVEDDEYLVSLFEKLLKIKSHQVVGKAYDGEQAVKLYRSFQNHPDVVPDIVLMDYRMPKKSGLDATKEILSINSDSKIIFISSDFSIRKQALMAGAVDFLIKPVGFPEILQAINKITSKMIVPSKKKESMINQETNGGRNVITPFLHQTMD